MVARNQEWRNNCHYKRFNTLSESPDDTGADNVKRLAKYYRSRWKRYAQRKRRRNSIWNVRTCESTPKVIAVDAVYGRI
jgi:hypothetical protein